jgi:hypothetical protein
VKEHSYLSQEIERSNRKTQSQYIPFKGTHPETHFPQLDLTFHDYTMSHSSVQNLNLPGAGGVSGKGGGGGRGEK